MFTIKLISQQGEPISNKKITVHMSGILRGFKDGYTSSDGEADFHIEDGEGEVYVNGKCIDKCYLSGLKRFRINE